MKTHFPTVPVEIALQNALSNEADRLRPLVLVVDDEPLIAETLAAILNASGLAAITAPDGSAALEIARLMPPDMLITDVELSGRSGYDLAIEVKRTIPDCEIILFSSPTPDRDLVASFDAAEHNFAVLVKPVHPEELLSLVFECCNQRGCVVPSQDAAGRDSPRDVS